MWFRYCSKFVVLYWSLFNVCFNGHFNHYVFFNYLMSWEYIFFFFALIIIYWMKICINGPTLYWKIQHYYYYINFVRSFGLDVRLMWSEGHVRLFVHYLMFYRNMMAFYIDHIVSLLCELCPAVKQVEKIILVGASDFDLYVLHTIAMQVQWTQNLKMLLLW